MIWIAIVAIVGWTIYATTALLCSRFGSDSIKWASEEAQAKVIHDNLRYGGFRKGGPLRDAIVEAYKAEAERK